MADITATHSTGKDDWGTPWWFVYLLEQEFGPIDLDPCASYKSAKAPIFFTEEDDGLAKRWFGTVFVNPPYSQMARWAEKAHEQASLGNTKNILFLCAARTDTRAWWDFIRHGEVRLIKGRLKFIDTAREVVLGAPFPSALVVFSQNMWKTPSTVYWDIPKEARKDE